MHIKKLATLCLCLLFLTLEAMAQDGNKLKGKVLDKSGEAIIGAQVRWKDTKVVSVTNIDGDFTITKDPSAKILVISSIGFKTLEVDMTKKTEPLVVKLEDDAQMLDELLVVGYGLQKKMAITGAVETVKAEDLLMVPTTNLDQALAGHVAGLQVMQSTGDPSSNKEAAMHIRGINSNPLLVIDGVPRFGTNTSDGEMRLSDLNPDDIESITILKDAAAAAVYGSRAANGVILVQTKRAKGNQKVKVNYRGQFNLQEATKMPDFLDAYEFAKLYNRAIENSPATQTVPYTDEQLEAIRTGAKPNVYGNENLLDHINRFGHSMTNSVSASGGNDYVRYYLSLGHAGSKGLYSGLHRSRINYNIKLDATLAKGLMLSVDYIGSNSSSKNNSFATLDGAYASSPLQVLRFTNGSLASVNSGNPLINIYGLGGYLKDQSRMGTLTVNASYDIPFVKGLSTYLRGTFDSNSRINTKVSNPVTLYTYDEATDTYKADPNTLAPKAKSTMEKQNRFYNSQLYEWGLNYNRTFKEKHDVGATLVMNYQRLNNEYLEGVNKEKSPRPEVMGVAVGERSVLGDETINERASLIGRLNYGYRSTYFAEFSFRVDGSTNFAPSKRWGFFPSLSASWIMSNEAFFRNWKQNVLSNVKFRASTGLLGNDGIVDAYSYLLTYLESANYGYSIGGNYTSGLSVNSAPNLDLSWGKSHDYNFGTDLGFWDGRIGLSFEYYIRYETDKLTYAPSYLFPPSVGTNGNVPVMNIAKLKAWGWDLSLSHKNTVGKLKYNMSVSLAKNNDKYLDYGDESNELPNLRRVGRSSMLWRMYQADGLFQSFDEIANHQVDQDGAGNSTLAPGDIRYVDQNGDKVLDSNDMIFVKNSSNPDFDLGFKLGANYKGIFFNVMFQGATGYQQNIKDMYTLDGNSLPRLQRYHLEDTWSETNINARYPRLKFASSSDNNRKESTFWVQDANFLRLKTVNVGYSFPSTILKKLSLSSLSVALQASNLFTWSSLKNMDPETLRGYPVQKSYGLTVNLGF